MNNGCTIIWSFRNRLDVLKQSILSAHNTAPLEVNFCLVDAASTDETIKGLREFCSSIPGRSIRICESLYRSSLSEAWNLGMMLSDTRYVIFSSSDVNFLKVGWHEVLMSSMVQDGNQYVLLENHAVFGFDKCAIPKMGWFDEIFKIGPHFDVDYMIRASENNVKFAVLPKNGFYAHADEVETTKQRLSGDVKDRLPMHDRHNEFYFQKKWLSDWVGWGNPPDEGGHMPHPPTHISQVKRAMPEVDPHPLYTKKYRE